MDLKKNIFFFSFCRLPCQLRLDARLPLFSRDLSHFWPTYACFISPFMCFFLWTDCPVWSSAPHALRVNVCVCVCLLWKMSGAKGGYSSVIHRATCKNNSASSSKISLSIYCAAMISYAISLSWREWRSAPLLQWRWGLFFLLAGRQPGTQGDATPIKVYFDRFLMDFLATNSDKSWFKLFHPVDFGYFPPRWAEKKLILRDRKTEAHNQDGKRC